MNIQYTLRRLYAALVACTAIGIATTQWAHADEPVAVTVPQHVAGEAAGQTEATIPSGAPESISDWALAGIVWSDASLTKKLASDALKQPNTPEQTEALQRLLVESNRIVQSLEQFGWKHARQSTPSSQEVAVQKVAVPGTEPVVTAETPLATSGRTAPAAVENAVPTGPEVPLEPFGVEDYVDETAAEANNPVDAREDGVEAAIAAAPSSDIPGPEPGAGRISQREVQTRSTTLPYSVDSIYDADDYDPDVDYDVDNPLAAQSVSPRTTDLLDDDHQVATNVVPGRDGVRAIDADAGVVRPAEFDNPLTARAPLAVRTQLDRFTTDATRHQQDAAWVQLRLNENQLRYASLAGRANLVGSVSQALQQLQTTAMIAGRSTDDESLKSVLAPVLQLSIKD